MRVVPATTTGDFSEAQILQALGVTNASGASQIKFGSVTGDGTGQTIAIIDPGTDPDLLSSASPNYSTNSNDLHVFDQNNGLPDPASFQIVNQQGGSTLPTNVINAVEECPTSNMRTPSLRKANIILVEVNSNNFSDFIGPKPGGTFTPQRRRRLR